MTPVQAATDRPVLVVDNFDSFVYNLVQYLGQLGVRCIVRRNDAVDVDELAASPQVQVFEQAVEAFGLTFTVEGRSEVRLPAYHGSLEMQYATTG